MTPVLDGLVQEYLAALQDYLSQPGEAALSQAYALGRRGLGQGLGILDLAALHHRALLALVMPAGAADQPRLARAAGDFFGEALSPFEMTLRGYREANQELQRLNETLLHQKDELLAVNRELESFSYSVSHDLRAPLRSIDGFSLALLEDCADQLDSTGRQHLQHVRQSAQHMGHLIDDLLALARVTRGELQRAEVDLVALARRIVDRLRARAPERQADVLVLIEEGLTVEADARLLEVALENLLGNAWKFTAKRPQARIELGRREEGGRSVFFVRDNGAGFDMAYAGKLFGVFQRLHSAAEFEGTGIGLATVQRIVQRHGGRVWAEAAVDAGATFYFTLGGGSSG